MIKGWARLSKGTLLLNSVYVGNNETFNDLNKTVDLLSKGGFQFPKYTRIDNTLFTCK